jgi:hypothetical protein
MPREEESCAWAGTSDDAAGGGGAGAVEVGAGGGGAGAVEVGAGGGGAGVVEVGAGGGAGAVVVGAGGGDVVATWASTEVVDEGAGAAEVEGLSSTTNDGVGTVKEGNTGDGEGGATGLLEDEETDEAAADSLVG